MRRTTALLAALVLAAGVSACSTEDEAPTGVEASQEAGGEEASDEALPEEVVAMLDGYDVAGQDVRQAIATLDQVDQARPLAFQGSVRGEEVLFSDGTQEVSVPIPGDEVYVSIAPFVQQTHECHFHALGSCQGEMVEETVQVTITDADGQTLVDEEVTTYANGFVGFWLPKGEQGTVAITQGDLSGETTFDTGPEGATCITTLQLT